MMEKPNVRALIERIRLARVANPQVRKHLPLLHASRRGEAIAVGLHSSYSMHETALDRGNEPIPKSAISRLKSGVVW